MEDVLGMNEEMHENLFWLSRVRLDESRYDDALELYAIDQPKAARAEVNETCNYKSDYRDKPRSKERTTDETQTAIGQYNTHPKFENRF